jgi:hypothetical protein
MLSYEFLDGKDPGVEFVVATSDSPLSSFVPSAVERSRNGGIWDPSQARSRDLIPPTALAPVLSAAESLESAQVSSNSNGDAVAVAPCLVAQITTFSCGGKAIALQAAHPLADAQALSFFAQDWAINARAINHAFVPNCPKPNFPAVLPIYNPSLLDESAAGDIDSLYPQVGLVEIARALPCHRYDWWAPLPASSKSFPTTATVVPSIFQEDRTLLERDAGDPMPWDEWDITKPVLHYMIHFSNVEIYRIWEAASMEGNVSKHDALLAHIWSCINRSRRVSNDQELVHLDVTIGLRTRISPPLPAKFMGSPIMLARVLACGHDASTDVPAIMAKRIQSTLAQFTAEKLAAHLHDKIHEISPQRIWQCFLGKRHLLVTSWVHTGVYEVDFGGGRPAYVEAVMPSCDGCVQVMEAAPTVTSENDSNKLKWWEGGVDVSVHLEKEAMKRLLTEPLLRKYKI